ncbi:uncharacterized protein TRIADDRAFT_22495 [Trichoplax adhaerens]|uniref:Ketimine reductase mu-crystallin n=1 Tax=Trichoplax adhaerens TaxID=10228 RepID=B3RRE4_TRIAD|nr:hypothetical protein TRIADDRAFT_22495 [Trichoplax adhaerens]EDV26330.1 hypothetical protein TRIADDRAFT_22495 [Trichoplax adhaerens]|eukprot:XP_002110326.1 hypothetical protein TRIADDRAFT_22495 [Trichoplax adhaerens]
MSNLLFIDEKTVQSLLDIRQLVDIIERALINFSIKAETIAQPIRTVVNIPSQSAHFFNMPCYSQQDNALATKLACLFPNNYKLALPTIHAVILLFDCNTGVPQAIIDADYVTEMRTAAASAVATKYLVNDNYNILCIIGSGAQARSHLLVMKAIFQFSEIRICSRSKSNAERLAKDTNTHAVIYDCVQDAVQDADVICTTTNTVDPIVFEKWIKQGAHINAVGACTPQRREIDGELMRNAVVVADSRESAKNEAGDIILANASVDAEIGEIASGKVTIDTNQTTVFESLGLAIEDAVCARLIYDLYNSRNVTTS